MASELLSVVKLSAALGERLPRRPSYRTILRAIEAGCPFVPDPLGRKRFRLFDLEAVWDWWQRMPPPPVRSAADSAFQHLRSRRPRPVAS
jgi:hypothetical protein